MARASSVAQTERSVRPFTTVVRKFGVGRKTCGNCGSPDIRPSQTRTAVDVLLACLFLTPYRCRLCRGRFYRFWRPGAWRAADPPVAPLLMMPTRREVITPDTVTPNRIEPEPVSSHRIHPRLFSHARTADKITPEFVPPVPMVKAELNVEVEPKVVAEPNAQVEDLPPSLEPPQVAVTTAALVAPVASILILESDLSIRKLLRRLLERRGYQIEEVGQAQNLTSHLATRHADLLVIDLSDTEPAGDQSLATLANAHPGLRILVLSAAPFSSQEFSRHVLALPKPFPLDSFIAAVDRLLERSDSAASGS